MFSNYHSVHVKFHVKYSTSMKSVLYVLVLLQMNGFFRNQKTTSPSLSSTQWGEKLMTHGDIYMTGTWTALLPPEKGLSVLLLSDCLIVLRLCCYGLAVLLLSDCPVAVWMYYGYLTLSYCCPTFLLMSDSPFALWLSYCRIFLCIEISKQNDKILLKILFTNSLYLTNLT